MKRRAEPVNDGQPMASFIEFLRAAVVFTVASIPLVVGIAWLTTKFQYRITSTHLEVTIFGACVRRIALSDIRGISARRLRPEEWGEQWWNTLRPSRRFLTIRRRSGWLRYFVITPKHRYIFRAELKAAMAGLKLPTPIAEDTDGPDKETSGEQAAATDGGTPTPASAPAPPQAGQAAAPPPDQRPTA